ncbi:hypothetical protein JCGZ_06537 [Jatropha curcas]|uniref:Chalcone-flavanone isomerase family protein n=1 Tax=Jatropha curcas TaxID=180498 RepID=A0A067LQD0_JATCU|nr:uncharacterized protein LOC105628996 [Jatropha curcas]KDP46749.1 hypothetical protein JCGZ_06537 [Jatropha curcas]
METPSSTKRVTRSQTLAALSNSNNNNIPMSRKIEDSEKSVSKSRKSRGTTQKQDRSVLIDITNDSPIVGLAMGSLETPLSAIAKQRSISKAKNCNSTPGSGEALLRGQVKTLLQKVEEEAELSKISLENRPFLQIQGFSASPMVLLAPTPANTPQIPNFSGDDQILNSNNGVNVTPLPVIEEQMKICQVVSEIFDGKKEESSIESQKSLTRSLLLDFSVSEKSEVCDSALSEECTSVVTTCKEKKASPTKDDYDSASNWSVQVNASTHDGEEEMEEIEEEEDFCCDDYYEEDDLLDALCEGIGKISVTETNNSMAAAIFEGKHKRFSYNSDDEIVEEEVMGCACSSPSILHLKGLPTPKGKHLRFRMEEEEEED